MIIKKELTKYATSKVERKSLALKAKKESSDKKCLTSGSEDEEYAWLHKDKKLLSEVCLGVIDGEEDDEMVQN
ncbi:hypothetical protein Tco_0414490 [Tanacetum coccineum]